MNGVELIGLAVSAGSVGVPGRGLIETGVVRMTANDWIQLALYFGVLLALTKPLGAYMARVYQGQPCGLDRGLGWLERLIYRLGGVDPKEEMTWKKYAVAMLLFNVVGFLAVYLLLRLQAVLPLNPQQFAANSPDLAFNTAASFATNTNWQSYGGETTMSYLSQMLGLGVQNFVSAATGMAVLVALIRGLARRIGRHDRQLLVRPGAHDGLHPVAAVAGAGVGAGVARRDPKLQIVRDGDAGSAGQRAPTASRSPR